MTVGPDHDAETRALPAPVPASTNVMLSGRRLGRYLVGTRLGAGGMGSVWNAYDEALNRHVALKVLAAHNWESAEARQRLRREARAAALLDHPNIAMIYDVGEVDGAPWVAMQLVSGFTLRETMRDERIRAEQAATWVAQLADALAHAHARGVLHRDVSSNNVNIDPSGRPMLIDFGLAQASCMPRVTESGRVMGTIHYLAPELLDGQDPDPRSDLYSLGILLFELLTGTLPFPSEPPGRYLLSASRDPARDVRSLAPHIPEAIADATMMAIARDPSRRYRNAGEFRDAIATDPAVTVTPRDRQCSDGVKPRPTGAVELRFETAVELLKRSDVEEGLDAAVDSLSTLALDCPTDARTCAMLAIALVARWRLVKDPSDLERARAASIDADRSDPACAESHTARAEVLRSDGRSDLAVSLYELAIAAKPDFLPAHLGLSWALEGINDRPAAEAAARHAVAVAPDDWRGYSRLGACFFNAGAYARAAGPWFRGLELVPDNARLCSSYGSTLFHQDRLEEALAYYRRSMDIKPNSHAASNLATALFYRGRLEEAVADLEKAVAIAPDDPILWGNFGSAARLTPGFEARAADALDRAIQLMRAVLARDDSNGRNWAWLATWLASRGLVAEAEAAVARSLALSPNEVECIVIAGTVAELAGDRERAVRHLISSVRLGYGIARLARDPFLAPLRESQEWRLIEAAAAEKQDSPRVTSPS